MLSVLHSQYHACWCSGDFRSQRLNRRGIDPQSRNILSPASEDLISVCEKEKKKKKKMMVQNAIFINLTLLEYFVLLMLLFNQQFKENFKPAKIFCNESC